MRFLPKFDRTLTIAHDAFRYNPHNLSLGFVTLFAVLLALMPFHDVCAQGKSQLASVVVTKVVEREILTQETFIGTVTPRRRSIVGCAVDGRVQDFHVDEGDLVQLEQATDEPAASKNSRRRGQAVVQLRTKTIDISIAAAKAEQTIRENELKQLEASLPELLVQAKANAASKAAAAQFAESNNRRIEALFKRDRAVSDADREEAQSASIVAKQEHEAALAIQRELENTSDVKIAQANARLLAQDEEIRRLEDLKSKYTIRAPFEGYVVDKFTEVGQWVKQGDPVVEIVEVDPVEVVVSVPGSRIEQLQIDLAAHRRDDKPMKVGVHVDAIPDGDFDGEVINIIPQANLRTRSVPVKVRVKNPRGTKGHAIQPGMLAEVVIPIKKELLLVPKDALVLGVSRPTVFVVVTDHKTKAATAKPVEVTTGDAFESLIDVSGEIKKNDLVVVRGNERLRPGQAVRVVPAEK